MKDYYKIVGVERSANGIAIKKAYRKRAIILHPDVNKAPNAHEEFIELNEAYQVLNDHRKRIHYNQLYDYEILNKRTRRQSSYDKKHKRWEGSVNNSADKGKAKGTKYASESEKKFKSRINWKKVWIVVDIVLEVLWVIIKFVFRLVLRF